MCKFCNNKAKPIILNVERDGIMDEKVQVFQATIKGNELMFEIISNHLSTYFNLTTLKKRILYCPICGRNGEPIDCSTLEDEPVIVADNEADRQALRDCFKG